MTSFIFCTRFTTLATSSYEVSLDKHDLDSALHE